ncbi:MAG: hypothetical protein GWP10_03815 [Nitrospiraceae bacterium]|nr:hypothetical protein [Nitrospiraceae bacterium]
MKDRLVSSLVVLLAVLVAGIFCTGASVEAVGTSQVKIAVINMQRVVRNSVAGRKVMERLNKKFESLQKKLQTKQNEIKAFKEDLDRKAPLMNGDARIEKQREYKKKLRDFKDQSDDAQFEMRQEESKNMDPILKKLQKVVGHIGKKDGYTIILEKNMPGIYYVSPRVDISDQVIKIYDKQMEPKPKKNKK